MIRNKMKDGEQSDSDLSLNVIQDIITLDILEKEYNYSLSSKTRLEDKAKINIAALTISVSLMLGLSKIIADIYINIPFDWMCWFVFLITIMALFYMAVAGIMSIKVLVNENIVHRLGLSDHILPEKEIRDKYISCIYLNRQQNLIRNNYIFTAYECIRNSIICLIVVFVLSIFPFATNKSTKDMVPVSDKNYTLSYSSESMEYLIKNQNIDEVESIISTRINNIIIPDMGLISFIDETTQKFIKIECSDNNITVLYIDDYVK